MYSYVCVEPYVPTVHRGSSVHSIVYRGGGVCTLFEKNRMSQQEVLYSYVGVETYIPTLYREYVQLCLV